MAHHFVQKHQWVQRRAHGVCHLKGKYDIFIHIIQRNAVQSNEDMSGHLMDNMRTLEDQRNILSGPLLRRDQVVRTLPILLLAQNR